jgi:MFS family permease
MPLVSYFEQKKSNHLKIILFGSLLMSLSFAVLLLDAWVGILIVSIILMAFGIMFVFPFSNAFALSRSPQGKEGLYMGYYTMSFSVAHIASSKTGMEIIDNFGYINNWLVMFLLGILGTSLILIIHKKMKIEN